MPKAFPPWGKTPPLRGRWHEVPEGEQVAANVASRRMRGEQPLAASVGAPSFGTSCRQFPFWHGASRDGEGLLLRKSPRPLSQSLTALPALPKGEPLAKPHTLHLNRQLYRYTKGSPFGTDFPRPGENGKAKRGNKVAPKVTERVCLLPAAPPLPQEAGAADVASGHAPLL